MERFNFWSMRSQTGFSTIERRIFISG